MADKSVDLLKLLQDQALGSSKAGVRGLKIVRAVTTEPDAITFIFEGTKLALDMDIFEVPVGLYPIRKGDRFLAYPILGTGAASRWGLVQKLNGSRVTLATMVGPASLKIDGIDKVYAAAEIIAPAGLIAGYRVSVAAVVDGGIIKYAVLTKY